MNRVHEWLTQAHFQRDGKSTAKIVTQEGEIQFGVNVLEMVIETFKIYIKYELMMDDDLIDTHHFTCVWSKEETAWLEIH